MRKKFLTGLSHAAFCNGAAIILGDINHVHPFREGNGRTQLLYLQQLAVGAGFRVDFTRLGAQAWVAACVDAHHGRYEGLARLLAGAVTAI